MADIGTDFLLFLKAYYPNDVAKLSADKVDESLFTAILNKHQSNFELWLKVPERIRNEYFGRVPDDILNAARFDNNLTINDCRNVENNRYLPPCVNNYLPKEVADFMHFDHNDIMKMNVAAKPVMGKGYSYDTAMELVSASIARDKLIELMKVYKDNSLLYESFKAAYRRSREASRDAIKKDHIVNQPEKMLLHIAKELDRGKIDKDTALPQMFELMAKIKEQGGEQKLEELIQSPTSRYGKWKEDTRILFDGVCASYSPETVSSISRRLDDRRSIINNWRQNEPEKMLVHIAKELDRGKIDKDSALPQMFELMGKVKESGKEKELEALLQAPNSRYEKWSKENRALFNEVVQSHDVVEVAQRMNEVRERISTKENMAPVLPTNSSQKENTPPVLPTNSAQAQYHRQQNNNISR